jgi:hypothetical protein
MKYAEYKNEHRYKHYNLCWLDGEEKLVCYFKFDLYDFRNIKLIFGLFVFLGLFKSEQNN